MSTLLVVCQRFAKTHLRRSLNVRWCILHSYCFQGQRQRLRIGLIEIGGFVINEERTGRTGAGKSLKIRKVTIRGRTSSLADTKSAKNRNPSISSMFKMVSRRLNVVKDLKRTNRRSRSSLTEWRWSLEGFEATWQGNNDHDVNSRLETELLLLQ
jgi:hypothetical protein